MKIGETVICINNENKYMTENLTLNKKYIILNILSSGTTGRKYDYDVISVHDDIGQVIYFESIKFLTLNEYRDRQLGKLLTKENKILNFLKWK